MNCCLITDEEAQNWPLEENGYLCSEDCGDFVSTSCGHCGMQLCEKLDCIKSHAAKGCYNPNDAKLTPTPVNPHPTPDAGPSDHAQDALQEPVLDAQVTEV